jgi:heme/copper-type cytochrome/quinol oxidase subunit 2
MIVICFQLSELEAGDFRLLTCDRPLYIPTDVPIRILVTSLDTLHSFAIPALDLKIDAVPGRLNEWYLLIEFPGVFFGECSELCGVNHSVMPIELISSYFY